MVFYRAGAARVRGGSLDGLEMGQALPVLFAGGLCQMYLLIEYLAGAVLLLSVLAVCSRRLFVLSSFAAVAVIASAFAHVCRGCCRSLLPAGIAGRIAQGLILCMFIHAMRKCSHSI